MLEKVQGIIAEGLGVEADQVQLETRFKEDLGADSLDLFELVMSFEEEFGVEIPTEELEKMTKVSDIVDYIKAHE